MLRQQFGDLTDGGKRTGLEAAVAKMETNRQGILLGQQRAEMLKKKVGDRFTIHSFNYKEIDLEVEVFGILPTRRYDQSAAMNIDYLLGAIDSYKQKHNG